MQLNFPSDTFKNQPPAYKNKTQNNMAVEQAATE